MLDAQQCPQTYRKLKNTYFNVEDHDFAKQVALQAGLHFSTKKLARKDSESKVT